MIATVSPIPGAAPHRALFRLGGFAVACAVGARGISGADGADKTEGDKRTPGATMPLRRVLFRADRVRPPPATAVARAPLAPEDGWCDDPRHSSYNQRVVMPFDGRAEALWRVDPLYDVVVPLGWNDRPVVPGRGSAIFLHVAPPHDGPTEGCIGLPLPDLLTVLRAGLTGIDVRADTARR